MNARPIELQKYTKSGLISGKTNAKKAIVRYKKEKKHNFLQQYLR
jgi:hypothetical protein